MIHHLSGIHETADYRTDTQICLYYNDENELVGYDVDVAKEVAKRLGVEITFKEYNVDGQVSSLTRGEADFAANDFGLTDERAEKFSLSTPIKYSFDSMIVRKVMTLGLLL